MGRLDGASVPGCVSAGTSSPRQRLHPTGSSPGPRASYPGSSGSPANLTERTHLRGVLPVQPFPDSVGERDIEILRQMTPEQKLAVMRSLIRQAYALKAAGMRALHPELTEEEIEQRTKAAVAGDRA